MVDRERRVAFASLWVFGLAFGWIEASAVVYLREIYTRGLSLQPATVSGLQVTLVSLPSQLLVVEMAREACTVLLLGAVAWLAGRRAADRAGAFLLSFGIWDLTYYASLNLVLGWPDSLGAWDILFLIPSPWVAPVWAPVTVATLFALVGSYLFWTPERGRQYRWPDAGVLAASVLLTIAAFLVESRAVIDHRVPERFPVWLFWAGVVLGTTWFVRVERRVAATIGARRLPTTVESVVPSASGQVGLESVARDYARVRRHLDALVQEAWELAERFERLAHGLSAHPERTIIGVPDRFIRDPTEWDVIPSHPLPQIERLAGLTNEIREACGEVDDLRQQLILGGRADLVEQPDGFFF